MANPQLLRVPVMRELLNVVDEAEELPLRIDLLPSAEREPIKPLVVAEVAEDGLHRGEALIVDPQIQGGVPVFAGTRVPVKNLFDYLEAGEALRSGPGI